LSVESGPSILTLKHEHRSIIAPSRVGGNIVMYDFHALEPSVLLYEAGKRIDGDVYEHIAREVGGAPRAAVKQAVLARIYGQSREALREKLFGVIDDVDGFIEKVAAFFDVDKLLKRIKTQFLKSGRILNRYGRPIVVSDPLDRIFINYYAQSSAADVVMHGYKNVLDMMAIVAPNSNPIFLLHDALFVDCAPGELQKLQEISRIKVPGYVQKFTVRCDVLC
jgi:DNA polymerase I-like protein with 3'-5' exonuclease and polymerase domains